MGRVALVFFIVGVFFLGVGFLSWDHIPHWQAAAEIIFGGLLVLSAIQYAFGGEEKESHMNEIVHLEQQLQSIHWRMKGSTSERGQVSRPRGRYLAALQQEERKIEGQISEFWKRHHYENGRAGGKIIEGGPGPYR